MFFKLKEHSCVRSDRTDGAENPWFSTDADAHSLAARDASDAWWLHILSYPHRIDDRDFDDLKQRHHGE